MFNRKHAGSGAAQGARRAIEAGPEFVGDDEADVGIELDV